MAPSRLTNPPGGSSLATHEPGFGSQPAFTAKCLVTGTTAAEAL